MQVLTMIITGLGIAALVVWLMGSIYINLFRPWDKERRGP